MGLFIGSFFILNKVFWVLKIVLGGDGFVEDIWSFIGDVKVIKNDIEIVGMCVCYVWDGVVFIEYFVWFED